MPQYKYYDTVHCNFINTHARTHARTRTHSRTHARTHARKMNFNGCQRFIKRDNLLIAIVH